jgi:AcrR family transcriptional regulator
MPAEVGVRRKALRARARNGGASSPRVRIAELQRARLIAAAVLVVDEVGWTATTVAHVTARAGVSRRTFYELFEGREDCLRAVLEDIAQRVEGEIAAAELSGLGWADRVRGGLFAILSFFDREPVLARLCVVGALQGGPRVLVWREEILARLAAIVDEGRTEGARAGECTVLTAEGLVGAASAIVFTRLQASRPQEPLVNLQGELMSMLVLPYLGPAAARAERNRSLPAPDQGKGEGGVRERAQGAITAPDLLREIPMRLTYRTALVLDGVRRNPGASNRVIGESADIYDQGQISKLLSRLARLGLVANTGDGQAKGEPNAWTLTPLGSRVASSIAGHSDVHAQGVGA